MFQAVRSMPEFENARRSVSRVLFILAKRMRWPFIWGVRRRTPRATYPDGGTKTCEYRPYSVLLPVGFTMPSALPRTRCALTAPFHPYPATGEPAAGRFAFCGTFPRVAPAGRYPAPCFRGARTFLPPAGFPCRKAAIRPSDYCYIALICKDFSLFAAMPT